SNWVKTYGSLPTVCTKAPVASLVRSAPSYSSSIVSGPGARSAAGRTARKPPSTSSAVAGGGWPPRGTHALAPFPSTPVNQMIDAVSCSVPDTTIAPWKVGRAGSTSSRASYCETWKVVGSRSVGRGVSATRAGGATVGGGLTTTASWTAGGAATG